MKPPLIFGIPLTRDTARLITSELIKTIREHYREINGRKTTLPEVPAQPVEPCQFVANPKGWKP